MSAARASGSLFGMLTISARSNRALLLCGMIAGVFVSALAGCDQTAADKKLIQVAWDRMKAACEGRDGQAALKVYNQATFEHYGKVVKLGVDGDYGAVLTQPPTTVAEILAMRTDATRGMLEKLDGKGYVALAVDRGWWEESLDGLSIKNVKVAGDFATATMHYPELEKAYRAQRFERSLLPGGGSFGSRRLGVRVRASGQRMEKPPEYAVKFVKEADGWKFDELSMLPHWDREINDECNAARMAMRDYMMEMYARDDEDKLPMSIWQPMPKK